MTRSKNLPLPLLAAFVASSTLPAAAQVSLELSSLIAYRQNKSNINFKGGSFDIVMNDGAGTYVCTPSSVYYPPGNYVNADCNPGATGYVSEGTLGGASVATPYVTVRNIVSSTIIAPYRADEIQLIAAPASTLPRPSGDFKENTATVFYNITGTDVRDYTLTQYYTTYNYSAKQRSKFESQIVSGAYRYIFPRLNSTQTIPISAVIYPMAEGYAKKNNRYKGFRFTKVNGTNVYANSKGWGKDGYVPLYYSKPNIIEWSGLTPDVVLAGVDNLYFSFRPLRTPNKPDSSNVIRGYSYFPSFTDAGSDPRVRMANAFVTKYTLPPVFPPGTRGVIELELQRTLQSGGVTYDYSNRLFQMPVSIVDNYNDFKALQLKKSKKSGILQDADGDGYNNLTEWILESNPTQAGSIPIPPIAAAHEDVVVDVTIPWFGFNVNIKDGTIPAVVYTLQRSTDGGATWNEFVTDTDWTVETVNTTINNVPIRQIQVRSLYEVDAIPVQPVGTASHLYRVKITLQ